MIPYGRQSIDDDDIAAVVEALRSDFITQGPAIEEFERTVAEYCGVKHAVAVSNGTAALHVAVLAAGLRAGERLWTSPITFVASANCARYVGADVDFVDIDPDTLNLDPVALAEKLERAAAEGTLPKVVIPVHFGGQSCDMDRISELAERYGFTVIEDASHAIGGSWNGDKVGSCARSWMTTFSFHPVKIVTTAEGGMVTTNDEDIAERLKLFRTHGVTRDTSLMRNPSEGGWYYEQVELGYNYRLTDIQAALGTSQMRRIDGFVERRNELAARYAELLSGLPLDVQQVLPAAHSAYHLFVVRLRDESAASRREFFDRLREAGIGANVHYIPVHLQPYYRDLGFGPGDFPVAEAYYRRAVTLPLYPAMTDADQDAVVAAVRGALG